MGLYTNREGDSRPLPPMGGDEALLRELRRQARSREPLKPADEERLIHQAALGDRASEDRLVAANLTMVIRLATERGEQGVSVLDLVQEGSIGLVEAVRSFSTSGETNFAGYAERKVVQQMESAIATETAAVRDAQLLVAAATDYERAQVVLRRELQREPVAAEIAEKLEWTVDRTLYVAQVVADARRRHDEEMLAFIDPEALDFDIDQDERPELDA
ncbi:MAG TPA: sigma factor [Candidatus Baltobacterales bacterium]|nr:sigma factor [Candidatus Baltobacterales bacterium]